MYEMVMYTLHVCHTCIFLGMHMNQIDFDVLFLKFIIWLYAHTRSVCIFYVLDTAKESFKNSHSSQMPGGRG